MARRFLLGSCSVGLSLVVLAACGTSGTNTDEDVTPGGRGGSAGAAGSSQGGKAGSSGKAGAAGTSGAAGKGGTGIGGLGGDGGAAGSGDSGAAGEGGASGASGAPTCSPGRADCDGDPSNGCETDLTGSLANCGSCGNACGEAGPNSNLTCQNSTCTTTCFLGFSNCDGDPTNGCEINTNEDINHCGTCDAPVCTDGSNGSAACSGGNCTFDCGAGFGNCDGELANGCESVFATDVKNCGSCGNDCGEGATCKNGACECAASSSVAELIPVDLHLVLDKSGSMSDALECKLVWPIPPIYDCSKETKWSEVTGALKSFISGSTAADKLGVGLTLFPKGAGEAACPVNLYSTPDVETADLPGAAAALTSAINAAAPDGENTPTRPALEGGLTHAAAFQSSHPGRKSVVVLATDGAPTGCSSNGTANVATTAANGLKAGVPTYVIGVFTKGALFGNSDAEDTLNQWASAGGTNKAFIANVSSNLAADFKAALDQIRKTAIGCEYVVPQPTNGQPFDPNKVNVLYTPGGGADQTLLYVPDAASCVADGWYYDDPANPKKILLCPQLCPTVKADAAAKVQISVGCSTRKD